MIKVNIPAIKTLSVTFMKHPESGFAAASAMIIWARDLLFAIPSAVISRH